jgi:hypothetical protein
MEYRENYNKNSFLKSSRLENLDRSNNSIIVKYNKEIFDRKFSTFKNNVLISRSKSKKTNFQSKKFFDLTSKNDFKLNLNKQNKMSL